MCAHCREPKLYCELCGFLSECQSGLKRHMQTHTRQRPFACALCSYRATQKEHVARHTKAKHTTESSAYGGHGLAHATYENSSGDVSTKEQVCTATGEPQDMCILPQDLTVLPQETSILLQEKPILPRTDFCKNKNLFACNFCSMTFAKAISLYKHVRLQHGKTEPDGLQCVRSVHVPHRQSP